MLKKLYVCIYIHTHKQTHKKPLRVKKKKLLYMSKKEILKS